MLDILIRGGTVVDGTGAPPRRAGVGIKDGVITAVGAVDEPAMRVIEADGLLVTPGWIDIHTHYDGQATWDPWLEPSFSSGVTTAIMGNCGVGFAPIRSGDEERLIELMEGVEEIPGTALHAGMDWRWNGFPEYMDALDRMERSFDVGVMLPHGPVRLYVLGAKVGTNKCASGDELAQMSAIVDEAMRCGAFGLSTSRTAMHRTALGDNTPDFNVDKPELLELASMVARHGGIFQTTPAGATGDDVEGLHEEMELYGELVGESGVTLHFLVLQTRQDEGFWRAQIDWAERVNAAGGEVFALVGGRALGTFVGFFGSHPFFDRPTFKRIKQGFPRSEWLRELARPEIKARILAETNPPGSRGAYFQQYWNDCYDQTGETEFEPDESLKLYKVADRDGRPIEDVAYDLMLQSADRPMMMLAVANYDGGNFDQLADMIERPGALLSLSDAGAHVNTICDGMLHTFMLTHWVRDRSRGRRFAIEDAVRLMTGDAARAFRLADRGILAPGYKADVNVIDSERLSLKSPRYVADLPAGATRLLQSATGYRATIVSGVLTRENDSPTGALPGRLLRYRAGLDVGMVGQEAVDALERS